MLSDKEMKKKFLLLAQKNPQKHYPFDALKKLDFERKKCKKCKKFFWTTTEREICGDVSCTESIDFIGNSPVKKKLDYIESWKKFARVFKKLNYEEIKRYPSVARWNPTAEFTIASIAAFQPYIVSGEVKPLTDKLVIPQFCLRFSDVDNVGITGHMVGFIMQGQHTFVPVEKYDTNNYLNEIYTWLDKGLGLPKNEITFHEDAWAGGGNFGPCIEFFSRGLEIGNQVYMQYEQKKQGYKELKVKVLDMGQGQERVAWLSQGTNTIYDATFPTVIKKLSKQIGFKIDKDLQNQFLPYSSLLNIDEAVDIEKNWRLVAKKMNLNVKELRKEIAPTAALYSIAEHSRALLVALNDGALPSNTGGGYNLRMLIRRSLGFIDKYNWDVDLNDVCKWHADYLKPIFPELSKDLDSVQKIFEIEKKKHKKTKESTKRLVANLDLKKLKEKDLLKLYDSKGINPEMIPGVKIPDDFYAKVSELHEKKAVQKAEVKNEVNFGSLTDTKALYYDDYSKVKFKGQVLKIVKDLVVLDKTAFYPSSGGQVHDFGSLGGSEVLDIWKQGSLIVHKVKDLSFKKGEVIEGLIDRERRLQLSQHHTAAHIVNAAARKVLGRHINQAGAYKDVEKGRLDITHYDSLSQNEVRKIEDEANIIIKKEIDIESKFYPRSEAEKKFGMEIYQGGAVPGRMLRIVNIKGVDVEACGGTHLKNTKDVEKIKIIKSSKIQDGVVRLVFVAGKAAMKEEESKGEVVEELMKLLDCRREEVPGRCSELFSLWKKVVKKKKDVEKKLVSDEKFKGEILLESSKRLKTQPEHVVKTVKRFMKELRI